MHIATKFPGIRDWTTFPLDTDSVRNRIWTKVKCISILSVSNSPRNPLLFCCPSHPNLLLELLEHGKLFPFLRKHHSGSHSSRSKVITENSFLLRCQRRVSVIQYPVVIDIFHKSVFPGGTIPWVQQKVSNNRDFSCLWQVSGRKILDHIFTQLWTHCHLFLVTWPWLLSPSFPLQALVWPIPLIPIVSWPPAPALDPKKSNSNPSTWSSLPNPLTQRWKSDRKKKLSKIEETVPSIRKRV